MTHTEKLQQELDELRKKANEKHAELLRHLNSQIKYRKFEDVEKTFKDFLLEEKLNFIERENCILLEVPLVKQSVLELMIKYGRWLEKNNL